MKKIIGIILALVVLGWTGNSAMAGDLEPPAAPAPTMHTLDEIYNVVADTNSKVTQCTTFEAGVPQTGQETSYATGDDGDLEPGVAWPSPRFTDNGNGTVTDNLTGLIWLKNADPCGGKIWTETIAWCNALASGTDGLTDGSVAGDWRLPTINELKNLVDYSQYDPCLPPGHPFTGQLSFYYWSSTTYASTTNYAWFVHFQAGDNYGNSKSNGYLVWAVRGGQ